MAWRSAALGVRRSLELAHTSLLAGGLPVGSVLLDHDGAVVAEGRNRAYDPPAGEDRLQGSPIAHAEMNALAVVSTDLDLTAMTLWSSQLPCAMCTAACEFVGVGTVRFVAPDPSDPHVRAEPADADNRWVIVATLMFLSGVSAYSGPSAPTIARARVSEPETALLLDAIEPARLRAPTLQQSTAPIWSQVESAAEQRRCRVRR